MASYKFSEDTIKDINEICDYIAQNNPHSASNLFDAIRQKCKLVANFPNMGKRYEQVRPNLRGFLLSAQVMHE
ncbi:MAG: type II toxin-antitoxin system RelE/ParE family toxin [Moorea sp. SIO2B7]|nr:type II toxin-antitoxin system RelE/ParE family toxin [Moorena sp. SIO2B7]